MVRTKQFLLSPVKEPFVVQPAASGKPVELIEPGRLIFSGPVKQRPAFETLLTKNRFPLIRPRERSDGTLPHPGHGLPSYTDPLTASHAGAPNSGHTPGTPHPGTLDFFIAPGDHKHAKVCKTRDCAHVGKTELRPNPLTQHIGQPYVDDPTISFVTVEWARAEQIQEARFIATGCGWTLRSVSHPGKLLVHDEPEHPSIARLQRQIDVLTEALGLPKPIAGGAANTPAYTFQSGSHSAQLFRQATALPWNPAGGVVSPGDYLVTQNGTPNMTVNIAGGVPGGQILVPRSGTTYAGLYYGWNDAAVNLTGFTAPSSNTWISTVFVQAEDEAYGDADTVFQLGFVTGSAAGSPVAPTLAVSAMALANIAIASTSTSITTGMITDKRVHAGPAGTLWGLISSSGTILGGSGGYTAAHTSTGVYTITFNTAFANADYAVLASPYASAAPAVATNTSSSTTGFVVDTFASNTGTSADHAWSFWLFGGGT